MKYLSRHSGFSLFAVVLSLFLAGCATEDKTHGVIIEIDNLEKIANIDAGNREYIDSYSAFKLETTDESLIRQINQIAVSGKFIYVLDKNQSQLLIFSSEGKFIGNIGRKGRGPTEFLSVSSFFINPNKKTINLVDPLAEAVLSYDMSGKFVEKKPFAIKGSGAITTMRYIGNGKVVCHANPNVFNDEMLFIVSADDYSMIAVLSHSQFTPDAGAYLMAAQPYSIVDGKLRFSTIFEKDIKAYSNGKVESALLVEDNLKVATQGDLSRIAKEKSSNYFGVAADISNGGEFSGGVQNIFESDRFVLLTSLFGSPMILWDKRTSDGCIVESPKAWLPALTDISYSDGDKFVKIWDATKIVKFKSELDAGGVDRKDYSEQILNIADSYNADEDNPVLLIFNMTK